MLARIIICVRTIICVRIIICIGIICVRIICVRIIVCVRIIICVRMLSHQHNQTQPPTTGHMLLSMMCVPQMTEIMSLFTH